MGHSLFGADETRGFMMITSCTIDRPMFCFGPVSERLCVLDMKNDELTSGSICTVSVRNEGLLR